MTTIAYDGKSLAADTQTTRFFAAGHEQCPECNESIDSSLTFRDKIVVPKKTVLYKGHRVLAWGSAGAVRIIRAMDHAILNEMDLTHVHKILFLSKQKDTKLPLTGTIMVTEGPAFFIEITDREINVKDITDIPSAIGSGEALAKFVMNGLKLPAWTAVSAAALHDSHSGGEVTNYHIESRRKLKYKPTSVISAFEKISELLKVEQP